MSDTLPQITRIDFTDYDRRVVGEAIKIVANLVLALNEGAELVAVDLDMFRWIRKRGVELASVMVKMNLDKMQPEDLEDFLELTRGADRGVRRKLQRIKDLLERAAASNPDAHQKSALRRDMEWLIDELEKRL